MSFPSAFQIASDHSYVDFYIIDTVIGMAITIAQLEIFLYSQESLYLPYIWGWGSPYLCRFGDGVPNFIQLWGPHSYRKGPQTYKGVPISTIE